MLSTLTLFGIKVIVFRDDLNHATVSGNKLHKLAPNIQHAKALGCNTILSFGGPYSNHLHALAWASKQIGLSSIGLVRGELHEELTPTLKDCQKWGMTLRPLSRKAYRDYQEVLSVFDEPCLASEVDMSPVLAGHDSLDNSSFKGLDSTLIVPEGGSNVIAIDSVSKAYRSIFNSPECQGVTHAVCATGTGATLAGLYGAAPESVNVIGIQAVAEGEATLDRIKSWLASDTSRLSIEEGHLGRFAKMPANLMEFIDEFESQNGIPLDPVYTGKAMLKVTEMIEAGYFNSTDKILFIHTGGLQGKRGVKLGK